MLCVCFITDKQLNLSQQCDSWLVSLAEYSHADIPLIHFLSTHISHELHLIPLRNAQNHDLWVNTSPLNDWKIHCKNGQK